MKANLICRKCGAELNEKNWNPSQLKTNNRICKECWKERQRLWRKANPEKIKVNNTKSNRKQGHRPFNENKECSQFLGIHIAERVLSHVFKDVQVMPMHNPGYDIICNRDKRIDIKSACKQKKGNWSFHINHNTTADFFLCLAFDNREDLNPLHAWLIPGGKLNHLTTASIHQSTISKWDEYRLDTTKISDCCDAMK